MPQLLEVDQCCSCYAVSGRFASMMLTARGPCLLARLQAPKLLLRHRHVSSTTWRHRVHCKSCAAGFTLSSLEAIWPEGYTSAASRAQHLGQMCPGDARAIRQAMQGSAVLKVHCSQQRSAGSRCRHPALQGRLLQLLDEVTCLLQSMRTPLSFEIASRMHKSHSIFISISYYVGSSL